METADFLSEKNVKVTVIEMLDSPGRDILAGIGVRESLLERLAAKNVTILTGHRVVEIFNDTVGVSDRPLIGGGRQIEIPSRWVVLALGTRPEMPADEPGLPKHAVWYRVGDCWNPGNALDAIHQAFELAIRI